MGTIEVKRVVVDTNVLVSALLFGGTPGKLLPLWKKDRISPLASRELVDEYLRVLAYPKFQLFETEIDFLLTQEIIPWFEVVEVSPGEAFVANDPEDDKFIWCALAGKASCIISGDEHLLALSAPPVQIMTPALFLRKY